jgi:aldehyde:ferredoxin oxidoreductase
MLEPARDGEPEGIEMNFEGMKARFYELTGIDPVKGIPTKQKLEEHGMAEEAGKVW